MLIIIAPLYANAAYEQYNPLVVPIQGLEDQDKSKFVIDNVMEDDNRVSILVRNIQLSHEDFINDIYSRDHIALTKKELVNRYCSEIGFKPMTPSTPNIDLILSREKGKSIVNYYYDRTGQTLFFSIGAGPSSCDKD